MPKISLENSKLYNIYLFDFIKYSDALYKNTVPKSLFSNFFCAKINIKITNGINIIEHIYEIQNN